MGSEDEIKALLERDGVLSVSDFSSAWPDMPMASVYSRIRALLLSGRLSQAGRGKYVAVHKPEFQVPVTDWMTDVNSYLAETCEGVDNCIIQKDGNLYVEVAKPSVPAVFKSLKEKYAKVVLHKDAARFPAVLEGYIIIGHMVSDAPVKNVGSLTVPSLEKQLVDTICSNKEDPLVFQKAMEVYPVNLNRLHRYATRRGVSEELSARLSALNQERIQLFGATQKYLSTIPVKRAWVFGSFARGEETPASDLDLLVDYDKTSPISLLDIVRFKHGLQKIIGREVDLVENGFLKPFAAPSAEKDKYLIYER